jgi:hypothetical protein
VWPIILKATALFGAGRSHTMQAAMINKGKQNGHKRFMMVVDA